jgi:hypothetical protein
MDVHYILHRVIPRIDISRECLVWCPEQNKRIEPLRFFHGCRKTTTKGLIAVPPEIDCSVSYSLDTHLQPINVPTAGAQTFLMDYTQGIRAITYHGSPVRIGGFRH